MPKSGSILWSHWIKFLSFFLIAYGLAMVLIPHLMRTPVASILFDNHESFRTAFIARDEPQSTVLNVMSGLLGTVTTGWAIQMAWLAHNPFRNGEIWAWNALAMSISVWAALEFYYKLIEGINGIGLFTSDYGLPLLFRYWRPTDISILSYQPALKRNLHNEMASVS